jgi:hypothetical protein
MSFKGFSDRKKARALVPFLTIADQIPGVLFVCALEKSLQSEFLNPDDLKLDVLSYWRNKKTVEKLIPVVYLTSLLAGGLSQQGQDTLWITDNDEFASNERQLRGICEVFQRVGGHFLPNDLGHFRVTTTGIQTQQGGDVWVEDLVAIPDLIAGALPNIWLEMKGAKQ